MPLSAIDPGRYDQLLGEKCARTTAVLAPYDPPAPEIIASTRSGYRMRAEFRMWHDGDELNYAMFHPDAPKIPINITEFPIACERIQALMPVLLEHLRHNNTLRQKLFQIEFLGTLGGDMLVTLVYHRKLDEEWSTEAVQLARQLSIQIIGRSRKQKVVLERDFVYETLTIGGRDYHYRQYAQAFSQPNAAVNIKMIEWAGDCAAGLAGDLLELYCGNGNFTLPLARYFEQVIATELSKTSIKAARENLAANGIENVQMIRLSAEEVTAAINGEKEFRRLAELPMPLANYQLNTVFVDPPRAGLDSHTEKMVAGFNSIIYISCNPDTLAKNLAAICQTHRIERFALFDQFPYTHHMECGVFLRQREQ